MSDLPSVLPSFPTKDYAALLPNLEKNAISCTDLLTLDALEIAKRAQVPASDVQRLSDALTKALHQELGVAGGSNTSSNSLRCTGRELVENWQCITLGDERLDAVLGGGVPVGYITEFVGESGAAKTQFLLQLTLRVQLPPTLGGLGRSAIYVSTEAPLSTPRLSQILNGIQQRYPEAFAPEVHTKDKPSLDRVLCIHCADLETQDHIVTYQLDLAVQRHNVGLVVLDSIAANFRGDFDRDKGPKTPQGKNGQGANMARRSGDLVKLGRLLQTVANKHNVAVVVANQVGDRFLKLPFMPYHNNSKARTPPKNQVTDAQIAATTSTVPPQPEAQQAATPQPYEGFTNTPDLMTLDHQQNFFTGWGDELPPALQAKTPSLGLVWANIISARVALLKEDKTRRDDFIEDEIVEGPRQWRRRMKVVFAPWVAGGPGREVEFEIGANGVRSVGLADTADEGV